MLTGSMEGPGQRTGVFLDRRSRGLPSVPWTGPWLWQRSSYLLMVHGTRVLRGPQRWHAARESYAAAREGRGSPCPAGMTPG